VVILKIFIFCFFTAICSIATCRCIGTSLGILLLIVALRFYFSSFNTRQTINLQMSAPRDVDDTIIQLLSMWQADNDVHNILVLLSDRFHNELVREHAVVRLGDVDDATLMKIVPWLVQALKAERRHHSPLSEFILSRAQTNR
jgi:hypothetical protein